MRTACILLALVASAAAQSIPELETARTRNLLASPSLIEKAWGVYFAGHSHAKEWTEPLIAALREAAPLGHAATNSEPYAYVAALFDAVIESQIAVPPDVLEPFGERWRAPVIILLARDADAKTLVGLFEQQLPDPEWLAVNNLLLLRKSPRFFAKTLSETNILHIFTLTDPGAASGYGGSWGSGSCGDGLLVMPKGFPPIGVYELSTANKPGDVLLASGPRNSYYHRTVVPTDQQAGWGTCCCPIDRQKIRVGDLAKLGGISEQEATNLLVRRTRIEFRDDASLRKAWDEALAAHEADIRNFAAKAAEQGFTASGLHLTIVLELRDQRRTSGPTPPLTPREFVLE